MPISTAPPEEQGDSEDFLDFLSRVEDSACERGEPLIMIVADRDAPGVLQMHPRGYLELYADPALPVEQVPDEDVRRIHWARSLVRQLVNRPGKNKDEAEVMVVCSDSSTRYINVTPYMTQEGAETCYWDALHVPAYAHG